MNAISLMLDHRSTFLGLIKLIRLKQWVKNGFVLAPLVFSGEFLNLASIGQGVMAMLLFCLASSSTYIINDIHDIEHDKKHPVKSKKRPLASGQVKVFQAIWLLIGLYTALFLGYLQQPGVIMVIFSYLLLNVAYTFVLKQVPVIDIFTIALGFVLRVYAGSVALAIPASAWMLITTLCLALYLAAVKRRQELKLMGNEGRKVLRVYTVALIDRYAEIAAIGALLFYSLFVLTARPELAMTIPLVLYGLFRYWFLVEVFDDCESPTDALLSDWQLLLTLALWVSYCLWVLWPKGV